MAKVAVIAKLAAREGKRDELIEALSKLVEAAQSEDGTLVYVLHAAQDDPNVVLFYELYSSPEALAEHSGSEAMRAVGGQLAGLLGGAPELIRAEPRLAKGVDLP